MACDVFLTNHPRLFFIISMSSSATMSGFEFLDFSLCDPSPLDMGLGTGEDLSIGQFLEPLPSSFSPLWLPGLESAGTTSNGYSSLELHVLKDQHLTTPAPADSTVWINELIGSTGFFAPLTSELVHEKPKPFDGEVPVEDSCSADIKRYIQRTGKVPYFNVFAPEEMDFDAIVYPDSDNFSSDDHTEIPSTPIRRRVVSSPKRRKQLVSRSSSVTASDASDYAPSPVRNCTSTQKEVGTYRTARIKGPKVAVALQEPKDEPPAKKAKGRKTFNSACAADDIAAFAPIFTATLAVPSVTSSTVSSSSTSLSDSSDTETPTPSYSSKEVAKNKKRKFKEIDRDEDFKPTDKDDNLDFVAAKEERKKQPTSFQWTPVDKSYSWRKLNNEVQYRCDLCFAKDAMHLCRREGDMLRHLQSLKHTEKSFFCSNSGCSSGFTREDALKRHMKTCKV